MRILMIIFAWMFCSTAVFAETDIQEITTKGGIKVWLVEEHSIPLVAVRFGFTPKFLIASVTLSEKMESLS